MMRSLPRLRSNWLTLATARVQTRRRNHPQPSFSSVEGTGPRAVDSGRAAPARSVWLVNQYAITPEMPGISRHYEFARLLKGHGWDATVFAAALHHTTGRLRRGVRPWRPVLWEKNHGVRYCWLYTTPYRRNDWRRYVNMVSYLISLVGVTTGARKPDVIIGSSPHLLAGLGAWVASRRHRVPFLFEVRDVWPDMLVQLGLTSPAVIKPLTWVERFLYARAERVIALADGIAERIVAKGVPADKVVVIPNSMLPAAPLDAARRQAKRQELGWGDEVIVAWAGAHNPMNGLDVVVEAARLLADDPSIRFVFVGDGSLKQQLVEQARGLPNVTFYDPVPYAEIGEVLRAADIGLIHSRRFDAFTGTRPNKLFEYMAAGLPIVATVPGETWRLIEEAGAGVPAEWENPESLAAAVRALSGDPAHRHQLGQSGYAYVRDVHDRNSHVARLAAVLDEIVPATGPEPVGAATSSRRVEA